MKKNITIICTILSLILILDSANFGEKFVLFLFNGMVPYTDIILSPTQMLSLIIFVSVIVIAKSIVIPMFLKINSINPSKNIKNQPKKVPSRA